MSHAILYIFEFIFFQVRTLGCASLLASCCNNQLWLIDATGAYRVRAHALGNIHEDGDNLNQKLCEYDFASLSCREGLQILREMVTKRDKGCDVERMECAVIDSRNGRLVRV